MSKNRIIPQMFDVKPVDETGDLDWKKIQSIGGYSECAGDDSLGRIFDFQSEPETSIEQPLQYESMQVNAYILGQPINSSQVPIFHENEFDFGEACVGDEGRDINLENTQAAKAVQILEEKKQLQIAKEERRLLQIQEQNVLFQEQENMRKELEARKLMERQNQELAVRLEKEQKNLERMMFLEAEKKQLEQQQKVVMEKMQNLHREKEAVLLMQKTQEQKKRQETVTVEALARQAELKKIAEHNRQQQEAYEQAVLLERQQREQEQSAWLEKEMQAEAKAQKLQEAIASKIKKTKKKEVSKKSWFGVSESSDDFSWRDILFPKNLAFQFDINKSLRSFALVALMVSLSVGSVTYASKGFGLKGRVLGASADGLASLNSAVSDVAHQNFEGSAAQFADAYENFAKGSEQLNSMGGILLDATRYIPFASKVSSGKNALEAGKHFSTAGKSFNEVAKVVSEIKNPIDMSQQMDVSLLDVFKIAQINITDAKKELELAQQNVDKIAIVSPFCKLGGIFIGIWA